MTDDARPEPDNPTDYGGEAACALNRVCTECGAINDTPRSTCWRCGHASDTSEAAETP